MGPGISKVKEAVTLIHDINLESQFATLEADQLNHFSSEAEIVGYVKKLASKNMKGNRAEAEYDLSSYLESIKDNNVALKILNSGYFKPPRGEPSFFTSSDMLNITFLLIKHTADISSDQILLNILCEYPFNFSVSELLLIKNRIVNFQPIHQAGRSTLYF